VPTAITVGSINPQNDTVSAFSNAGSCLDLYAPGENIQSDWNTSDSATNVLNGTSMATPHVTGVAARWLELNPLASPAAVWTYLHTNTNDLPTTPGWPGLIGLPPGSPNELLHYGSVNTGEDDGDPHLTTVDGIHYNFQPAGEFVSLRDGGGTEIQTRQVPVSTVMNPPVDPYTGLAECVSLNSAVAARVGTHRVTYEPNLSGIPDPSGLQLRIDGTLTAMTPSGIDLPAGGRVAPAPTGPGIEIDFPDGTVMTATSNFWTAQGLWYLNMSVFHTQASEGILGSIEPGGWLPGMPGGTYLGTMPPLLHDRFVMLNDTFADAWRVTDASSLFDYATGTSTQTFTVPGWPPEAPPCLVPNSISDPAPPLDKKTAVKLCKPVKGDTPNGNCVFDVMVTGNPDMAKMDRVTQQIAAGATRTTVFDSQDTTFAGDTATFSARVAVLGTGGKKSVPTGRVQFSIDGEDVGAPIELDRKGNAVLQIALQQQGVLEVSARYLPSDGGTFLPSTSEDDAHTVK
jgi:hypothetical protein